MLVVVQFAAGGDPLGALTALGSGRRVLVRPPELATLPVPAGVELAITREYDRAALAARSRRSAAELVVVLRDDERPSPDLAAALTGIATAGGAAGAWASPLRVAFLDREIPADSATIAWRGAAPPAGSPRRLPGYVVTLPATVTETINRMQALAVSSRRSAPGGTGAFLVRPLVALTQRLWRRRRAGIPGFVLSVMEAYGEVLLAAEAWERDGSATQGSKRPSGVPADFHVWRTPWGSLTLRDGTSPDLRTALLDATPEATAGLALAGGRGAVWIVAADERGRGVLRWYRRGGAVRHLVRDLYFGWTPRPMRELAATQAAIERGVPAPEVLAVRVDRLPCGWYRGAIVTREVRDAVTFAAVLRHETAAVPRGRIVAAVGRAVRDLHARGVRHRDLNANNILVRRHDAGIEVFFIDFDRARVGETVSSRARARELRRLERSLTKLARGGLPLAAGDLEELRRAYEAGASA
ncbi:MAG: hypothetical protein B6D46_01795 [Polyangiaceae bacterium UTPRO1]|nr:hypothetical protein [Myxococcales bacterium]OQY68855.1 MAG: hypothetical protein B6D46_01795 [Polyangiaceae bacterium UTPRO1]